MQKLGGLAEMAGFLQGRCAKRRGRRSQPNPMVASPAALREVGLCLIDQQKGIPGRTAHYSEKPGRGSRRFRLPRRDAAAVMAGISEPAPDFVACLPCSGPRIMRTGSAPRFAPSPISACQRFPKGPDRIGIRHRVGQIQTEKAHERQPVADQVFGPLVRQIVAGLQNQRFQHQHLIEGRPPAFRAVRARHRALQIRPKQFEIDHPAQPLQPLAESCFSRSSMSKKPACPASPPPAQTRPIESQTRKTARFLQAFDFGRNVDAFLTDF